MNTNLHNRRGFLQKSALATLATLAGDNIVFADKKTQDEYQDHPSHVEFVEKVFKPLCKKVVVYDFQ